MKRSLTLAILCFVATGLFATGAPTVTSLHAQDGRDLKEMTISLSASPAEEGKLWLTGIYSYRLQPAETEKLATLVQAAAKKIDIAIANKTTISYTQKVGSFYASSGALLLVSFVTDGYESSFAVVRTMDNGRSDVIMLNKHDAQEFLKALGTVNSLAEDYQKQVDLFN
jgi:hypothetical protein